MNNSLIITFFSILAMDKQENNLNQTHLFIQGQCPPPSVFQEISALWRLHNFKRRTLSSSHYHTKPSNLNQMKICWYKKTKDHHLNYLVAAVAMKNLLGALGDSIFFLPFVLFPSSFLSHDYKSFRDLSVILFKLT